MNNTFILSTGNILEKLGFYSTRPLTSKEYKAVLSGSYVDLLKTGIGPEYFRSVQRFRASYTNQ